MLELTEGATSERAAVSRPYLVECARRVWHLRDQESVLTDPGEN